MMTGGSERTPNPKETALTDEVGARGGRGWALFVFPQGVADGVAEVPHSFSSSFNYSYDVTAW